MNVLNYTAIIVAMIGFIGSILTAILKNKETVVNIKQIKEQIEKIWNYINNDKEKNKAIEELYIVKEYYKEKFLQNKHCKNVIDNLIVYYIKLFERYYDTNFSLDGLKLYKAEFEGVNNKVLNELKLFCKQDKAKEHFLSNFSLLIEIHLSNLESVYFSSFNKKIVQRYEFWKKFIKDFIGLWQHSYIKDCPFDEKENK